MAIVHNIVVYRKMAMESMREVLTTAGVNTTIPCWRRLEAAWIWCSMSYTFSKCIRLTYILCDV